MPALRLEMHLVKEVLRLTHDGLSQRQIAQILRLGTGTVANYQQALRRAKLTWPLPETLRDDALAQLLWPATTETPASLNPKPLPDWGAFHQELKRKGVTRLLLWEEYREAHPEQHYHYTQFCCLYRAWRQGQKRSLRQAHRAGEKLFIDYCGLTVPIYQVATNTETPAQIFVAVLGASNYTYAEATWSQQLPDWIGAHVRAFSFFGGVPQLLVPDNLRSGVTVPCRYEPVLNASYDALLVHYGTTALPARPRKPRDKPKVEVAVQIVERWILARLRKQTFFSLAELNRAIAALLEDLNRRPFKKLPGTRRSQFETLDHPALKPLPATPYEYAEWKQCRVHIDSHLEVGGHYYSVPHTLVRAQLDVRVTEQTVECFYQNQRVAAHPRSRARGQHTTNSAHLPLPHQAQLEWTPARLLDWATRIGPHTRAVVQHLLDTRQHPEQAYRSCLGLLQLARRYDEARLERACQRAQHLGSPARRTIAAILEQGMDRVPLLEEVCDLRLWHENLRGAAYYQ